MGEYKVTGFFCRTCVLSIPTACGVNVTACDMGRATGALHGMASNVYVLIQCSSAAVRPCFFLGLLTDTFVV